MVKIRSVYNPGEPPPGLCFDEHPSLAKQSFEKEANVNNLVAKYMKTGVFYDNPGSRQPQYGDFSELGEYREIVDRVNLAREHFATLPADVRLEYNNDVGNYLDALASGELQTEEIEPEIKAENPPEEVETDENGPVST